MIICEQDNNDDADDMDDDALVLEITDDGCHWACVFEIMTMMTMLLK